MNFSTLGLPLCGEEAPTFLWLFDLSTPPPLLYYSYIPIVIASLLIAAYIFIKDNRSLKSRLLFALTIFFSLWVVNILVQWVASYNTVLMLGWQLTATLEVGMFLLAFYFAQVFLYNKDISFFWKVILACIGAIVFVLTPTAVNVEAYDLYNCEGIVGFLWNIIYALEPAVIVLIAWSGLHAFQKAPTLALKKQNALFTVGIVLFLATFFLSNYYGELTKVYEFNLWGPLGMVVFLILLGYLIVQYHSFHVKLFATQALVIGTAILIGSQLFTPQNLTDLYVMSATSVAFLISGIFLIRSVKREIEQREKIEELAGELQETNERQETLIHYIGHEVKGFLTKDEAAFAALSDGDFGVLTDGIKDFVGKALTQARDGVRSVIDILTAANQKKGTITYAKAPFDLKVAIAEAVEKARAVATEKKLELTFLVDDPNAPSMFNGDREKFSENVFRNLIDNAVNYTPSGSVTISLKKEGGKHILAVKDSGVGISEEDKKLLFTEGGHGKDAQKVNPHSTGYGLFIAKNIVEGHGGTIRAESEGQGKGSTFTVELPA